jgi:hypothetical protein
LVFLHTRQRSDIYRCAAEQGGSERTLYYVGSGDPPLDNKRDGIKRSETLVKSMVSVDFFTVATIRFQVLYVGA